MNIVEIIDKFGGNIEAIKDHVLLISIFILIFLAITIPIMISQERQKQNNEKPLVRENSWFRGEE